MSRTFTAALHQRKKPKNRGHIVRADGRPVRRAQHGQGFSDRLRSILKHYKI